jgi:hypothetical protein
VPDRLLGEGLGALRASGHETNTIIVLTGNNGYFLGEHGHLLQRRRATHASHHQPRAHHHRDRCLRFHSLLSYACIKHRPNDKIDRGRITVL